MVATIVVTVMGALCGLGVPGAVASGDDEDFPPSNGELGVYPDYGPSRQTFFDKGGRWRDGWCRRGEGYAVVVDFSDAPEGYRGDLTPTSAHIRQFGPTVADGWIVRCHEGPYGANVTSSSTAVDWSDALSSVGLFTKKTQDYKRPDPENTNEAVSDSAVKELLHVEVWKNPSVFLDISKNMSSTLACGFVRMPLVACRVGGRCMVPRRMTRGPRLVQVTESFSRMPMVMSRRVMSWMAPSSTSHMGRTNTIVRKVSTRAAFPERLGISLLCVWVRRRGIRGCIRDIRNEH